MGPLRLGLRLEASDESSIAAATFIDLLIALRKELRDAKQYQLADRICTGLGELDVLAHKDEAFEPNVVNDLF